MPTTEPLLHTKLHFPPVRSKLIARPRLVALLNEGLAHPLTLISAPAGFGKTTLLAEWRHAGPGQELPTAWLSLDSDNNELAQFLTYVSAAIGNLGSGLGESARALLQSPQPASVNSVLTMLINDLSALQHPSALILDDYHVINADTVHQAVMFLLDHLPEPMHLVITTRSDPPLPLARLRARGQLVEIRADDLRFTSNEAAAFLEQVMNLSLSPADISTLETRTEGWIAGLQIAALSMQGRSDLSQFIQDFSGSHRYILDYLAEEVLNRQPEEVQHFLMFTSVLERFCAPLCSEMVSENEAWARETLEYLDRANLFLVALDDERCWYRYHHLFADLLKARLRQTQPELVPQLHLRASKWYESNGLIGEAVQHASSARDYELAAELIEHYGPAYWSRGDPTILMLAGGLPSEALRTRPRVGIYQVWMLIAEGRLRDAMLLLNDLTPRISASVSPLDVVWIQGVAKLFVAYLTDPTDIQTPASLPNYSALDLIPEQDLGLRNTADVLYAMLLGRHGELDIAADILANSIERDVAAEGSTAILLAVPFLVRVRLMQGRLHEAAALCMEYLRPVTTRRVKLFYAAGSLNIALGEILREWNNLDGAEEQIRAGLQVNERWNNIVADVVGYCALARVQQGKGDLNGAWGTLQRLEQVLQGRKYPPDLENEYWALKVRLWLASGDLESAGRWADRIQLSEPPDLKHELDQLGLARIRIAQGRHADAQHVLEGMAQLPGLEKRVNRQIKIDLLLAIALYGQGLEQQAFQQLETCLSLAEPENHIRLFLDAGEPARKLLSDYIRAPAPLHKAYVQKLLNAYSQPSLPVKSAAALVESLSERELEVLGLVADGLSNQEIAGRLYLSVRTIKFHTGNIYSKLGVKHRTEAVARARNLGLLPS